MLDLTIMTRRLTQGQPPAEMSLAVQRRREPAAGALQGAPPAPLPAEPAPAGGEVDPYTIARRVYDLMCRELAVEHVRRARKRP